MLRRRADDAPARLIDAAAILFTVMLIVFEVRHYLTGDPYGEGSPLAETALDVSLLLALVIGLERLRLKSGSVVHALGAQFLAAIVFVMIVFSLGASDNPYFTGEPVSGRFINLILLGHGLPAVLVGILAVITRGKRPYWYSTTAAATALALALASLSLQICTLFHGPVLTQGGPPTPSNTPTRRSGSCSAWRCSPPASSSARCRCARIGRRGGARPCWKLFLIDMSDLTGIYRALSFLGLGAVLIGIGWFYQRLLFPKAPPPWRLPARSDRHGRRLWSARPIANSERTHERHRRNNSDKTVTGNYFEDFKLGQVIVHATPRTLTAGDAACSPRSTVRALPSVLRRLRPRIGYPRSPIDDLLVFHLVFGKTVPDISRNAIANLGYAESASSRRSFPATRWPRRPGDRGQGELQQEERHGLCALDRQEPARAPGAVLCALGDGQQARPRCAAALARRAGACGKRRALDARRGAPRPRPRRLRLCARRLAQALGRLSGRREDRPCRRPDHRGGRTPARHPPVPEHGAGAFQSACRGQGALRPPPRLWRRHHLDRAEP